jgi:hypothetical protein
LDEAMTARKPLLFVGESKSFHQWAVEPARNDSTRLLSKVHLERTSEVVIVADIVKHMHVLNIEAEGFHLEKGKTREGTKHNKERCTNKHISRRKRERERERKEEKHNIHTKNILTTQ